MTERRYINPYRLFNGAIVPNCILQCRELTQSAKLMLARMFQFSGKDGSCFPSIELLGQEIGIKKRQAQTVIKELERFGLIEIIRPRGKEKLHHKCNRYFFVNHKIYSSNYNDNSKKIQGNNESAVDCTLTSSSPLHIEENHSKRIIKEKNTKKENNFSDSFLSESSLSKNEHPSPPKETSPSSTKPQVKNFNPVAYRPEGITEKDWADLLDHRKNKKAKNTERALSALLAEFELAAQHGYTPSQCIDEMTIRNWTGFKAEWILNANNQGGFGKGTDTPAQPKKKLPVFFCAECRQFANGNCGKPSDKSCPQFEHLNRAIEALRRKHPRSLQRTSHIVPEPALPLVKKWRNNNKELWTA